MWYDNKKTSWFNELFVECVCLIITGDTCRIPETKQPDNSRKEILLNYKLSKKE